MEAFYERPATPGPRHASRCFFRCLLCHTDASCPGSGGGQQASGFLGAWCARGDPGKHASIAGNGVFLTLTNENGDTSPGNLQGSNQIQAPGWQFVTGTLSPDGSQINWSNGTYWARCENGGGNRSTLTGTWFANGDRSRSCSIQQRHGGLNLQNESGQTATGDYINRHQIHQLGRLRHPWKNQPAWQSHRLGQRNLLDKISRLLRAHRNNDNPCMRFIDRDEVARRLTYEVCIPLVREAMIAFSAGETRQLLRSIIPLADGRLFGVMPGALGAATAFRRQADQRLPGELRQGLQSHQGVVVLFEPRDRRAGLRRPRRRDHRHPHRRGERGGHRCARADGRARLAILGYGEQAATHARAIGKVRALAITVWGRSPERAEAFAEKMQAESACPVTAARRRRAAVAEADIVCTVTAASEPILQGRLGRGPGRTSTSSAPATPARLRWTTIWWPARASSPTAAKACWLKARSSCAPRHAGLIGDDHIVGEIGQVLAGDARGPPSSGRDHRLQVARPHRAGPRHRLGALLRGGYLT